MIRLRDLNAEQRSIYRREDGSLRRVNGYITEPAALLENIETGERQTVICESPTAAEVESARAKGALCCAKTSCPVGLGQLK